MMVVDMRIAAWEESPHPAADRLAERKAVGSMKKLLASVLALGLICAPLSMCRAEDVFSLGGPEGVTRYTEPLPCAEVRFDELFDDEMQAKAAQALSLYLINSYPYASDWYRQLWNHTRVILTEPHVFQTEVDEHGMTTIYCFGVVGSYALLRGDDGAQCFFQDLETEGLYRVYLFDDRIEDVERVTAMDEELYPGAGCADEGYPGLTHALEEQIPDQCWNTVHIARQYLDLNGIDASIIDQ